MVETNNITKLPMSKFSTLNFLINSYNSENKDLRFLTTDLSVALFENELFEMEPPKKSIDAILSFAAQYEVLKSENAGNIELNLN